MSSEKTTNNSDGTRTVKTTYDNGATKSVTTDKPTMTNWNPKVHSVERTPPKR